MSTFPPSSQSFIVPVFQSIFYEELLPAQAGDSRIITQGTKIKAIMEELEEQYASIHEDIKDGRYDITEWDSIRNLPVVYDACTQVDTLTTLMVHHAVQTLDRKLPFFVPGSSGKILPCSLSCGFMFVGLHKHTYIRGALGNIVPMSNEPPNAEEDTALSTVVSYCQRLGFLAADAALEDIEALKIEALKLLRKSEAELFTGQLIMERAMSANGADTTRDTNHDAGPSSEAGAGVDSSPSINRRRNTGTSATPAAQKSQPTTKSSDVQGQAPAKAHKKMNNAANKKDRAAEGMKAGLNVIKLTSLKWMPVQTPSSMSSPTAVEFREYIGADSEPASENVIESVEPVSKRARISMPDPASLSDEVPDRLPQHRTPTPVSDGEASDDDDDENSSRARYNLNLSRYRSPYTTPRNKHLSAPPQASSSSPAQPYGSSSIATNSPSNTPTPTPTTSEVLRNKGGLITGARGFRTVAPLPRFVADGTDQSAKLVLHYWEDDDAGVPRFHAQRYKPRGALKHGIDWSDEGHMATLNRWAMQQALRKGAPRARPNMRDREWVQEETDFLRELADKYNKKVEDGAGRASRKELFGEFNDRFADKEVEVTDRDGVKRVMRRFRRTNEALTAHADRTGALDVLKGKWGRRGAAVKKEPAEAENSGPAIKAEDGDDVAGPVDDGDGPDEGDTDDEM